MKENDAFEQDRSGSERESSPTAAPPGPLGGHRDLFAARLQRSAGNQAVQQMFGRGKGRPSHRFPGPIVQRLAEDGDASRTSSPPSTTGESSAAPASASTPSNLVVDDGTGELEPGQIHKSEFLAQLHTSVCAAAEEALAGSIFSALGCPWIDHWIRHYQGRDAAHVEEAVRRYVPEASGATTAAEYVTLVAARVRSSVAAWRRTGQVSGPLPEAPGGGGSEGGGLVTSSLRLVGRLFRKARPGSRRPGTPPAAVAAALGSGRSLDAGLRTRMESAFGADFSGVRIHADGSGAELSSRLRARAFTVGRHIAFGDGEYRPGTPLGDALIAHELAHVQQQGPGATRAEAKPEGAAAGSPGAEGALEADADRSAMAAVSALWGGLPGAAAEAGARLRSGLSLRSCSEETTYGEPGDVSRRLSTPELVQQIDSLRGRMALLPSDSPEHTAIEAYVSQLEEELLKRRPAETDLDVEGAYPNEIALLSSYLIRGRYLRSLEGLLPAGWRTMREAELTAWMSRSFTEEQLRSMFLKRYHARAAVKARFRKANIVAAVVIGLIWARENLEEGEWGTAAAKVGGSGVAAWAFNRLLYARDPAAAALMRAKGLNFGRWFQGVTRGNRAVNFLVRRVGGALLLLELKDLLQSGGGGGPNIPFDLIQEIDLDDPSTWHEPDQTLLDLGFNIWYRLKCSPSYPQACGATPIYLGKVEGSAIGGALKLLDIAPHRVPEARDRLYRIEGDWGYKDFFVVGVPGRKVTAEDNVLVLATGQRSGSQVSGRGHYRSLQVIPANQAALDLFEGDPRPRWVADYLLVGVGQREVR